MPKVLIADDSALMRRVLKDILQEGGYYDLSEAVDGLGAINEYKNYKPDLVLMDYNMPKLNGVESAREILQFDPKACIVMVTSLGGKKKLIEALRIGVKNYITKPFENNIFLATLRKVMGDKAPDLPENQALELEEDFPVICGSFGQFLLQKGVISKEQLLGSLEIQGEVNRKVGQIATDEGLLLQEQVEKLLKIQKRINKYFGQLAIQMGYLSHDQVNHLLKQQEEHYVEVEEILVREKFLTPENLEQEMGFFKGFDEGDQGVFNMRWVSNRIQQGFVFEVIIEQTLKLLMRLTEIFVLEGECSFERKSLSSHGILIQLPITGDFHWTYYLNISEDLAMQLAQAMLDNDDVGEDSKLLQIEAATEFLNIVGGNALTKLDRQGVKFDMQPPKVKKLAKEETLSFQEKEEVLTIPVLVPEGEMELIIVGINIFLPIESSTE